MASSIPMTYNEEQWLQWIDTISEHNFVVIDNFFTEELLAAVHLLFDQKVQLNDFKKASIGKGASMQEINSVRGDYIYWLDRDIDTPIESFFEIGDEMIKYFNRYCYLNLKSSEFHLAEYPVGSFYKQHLDQFNGTNNRMITFLLYLNKEWISTDEGQLRIHENGLHQDISPINNRCLIFKSDKVMHEVLPTNSIRKSLTGWLLYNGPLRD